jgi:hypothetical protein
MPIRRLLIPALLIITTVILSSCATSRRATSRYQTLTERAQVSLTLDQHRYSMSSQIRVWRNELAVISVQPMLGIEMVRLEATTDSVLVFDKMNRKYVALSYPDIERIFNTQLSYKTIQDFLTRPTNKDNTPLQMQFTSGKHQLHLSCTFSQREQNTLQAPIRTKTDKYQKVTLKELLPI